MEKAPVDRLSLDHAHGSRIGVGQDCLWSVWRSRNRAESFGDLVESIIPGDPLELTGALRSNSALRKEKAVAVIRPLDVSIHLRAQETLRKWMVRVSGDPNGAAVFDCHQHGARVRAVMRTSA